MTALTFSSKKELSLMETEKSWRNTHCFLSQTLLNKTEQWYYATRYNNQILVWVSFVTYSIIMKAFTNMGNQLQTYNRRTLKSIFLYSIFSHRNLMQLHTLKLLLLSVSLTSVISPPCYPDQPFPKVRPDQCANR